MKTLSLLLVILAGACAAETETIRYRADMTALDNMRGGTPIVSGDIFNGLQSMPEVAAHVAPNTTPLSTAKIEPFNPLIGAQQTDRYVQQITVNNLDTTGSVCLYLETWSQTCASSVAFTCLGATLQGVIVPAGASREVRVTGLQKVCATASEANVDAQLERTVFYAK